jgi:hypothetical protein
MISVVSQNIRGMDCGVKLYIINFDRIQGGDTTKDTTMGTPKDTTKDTTILPMDFGSKDTTMGTTKDTTMGTPKETQQKKLKKGSLEENITSPAQTAAPGVGVPKKPRMEPSKLEELDLLERIKKAKGHPWALWCIAYKHGKGHKVYPSPQGPDLKAAQTLKKLVPDEDELYYCMGKYLRDDDRYLTACAWALRNMPRRLDTYRNKYAKEQAKTEEASDAIPGESHDQSGFGNDEIEKMGAKREAETNRGS